MKITTEYEFTFGKHKGETVKEVMEYDSEYCLWCCENIKWFQCDKELEDEFEILIENTYPEEWDEHKDYTN